MKHLESRERERERERKRERERERLLYKGTTIKLIAVFLVRNDGGQKAVGWGMKSDKRKKKSCQPEILCLVNHLSKMKVE